MKDKYEISLWEDYLDETEDGVSFLNEKKLCVIGSNTMTTNARAIEPQMVNNINGTNTFTFKMCYTYLDEITGEPYKNPFLSLLINERKIKVFWKNKWYDMVLKNIREDSVGKTITYTCEDLFITELSKNGYNLEFSSDLQNNNGTAPDLVEQVLDGSGWQLDRENSVVLIEKREEPVYEVTVRANQSFSATKQFYSPSGVTPTGVYIIPGGAKILVFYSSITGARGKTTFQFIYDSSGEYYTEENGMLVLNGDCYRATFDDIHIGVDNVIYAYQTRGNSVTFTVDANEGISTRYRGNRLIDNSKTEYDPLLERYVNVYIDTTTQKKVYGYQTSEFPDPLNIINLVTNPSNFKNTSGWELVKYGGDRLLTFGVFPQFTSDTPIETYDAKSYLRIPGNSIVKNSAISSNKSYFISNQGQTRAGNLGSFHAGDKYVFRIKFKSNRYNEPSAYQYNEDIVPFIGEYKIIDDIPRKISYFSVGNRYHNSLVTKEWNEYILTCDVSCSVNDLDKINLYLENQNVNEYACWVEEVQFFKLAYGITSYDDEGVEHRINPGEVAVQSIKRNIYRFYNADHDGVTSLNDLTFLYEGEDDPSDGVSPRFTRLNNNYEKVSTIEASGSNRFNILQSIAESFKCWIRFTINHDSFGKVLLDESGLPQKYVTLVEYVGKDLGWSFEYGIDLQSISRQIISNDLITKLIVLPNDNQFGKNGFCSIARSKQNYARENFILNLDYYIEQGLLDKRKVYKDLYSTSDDAIGYFYFLNKNNTLYDEVTEILLQKQVELTKQQSQLTVLQGQLNATQEELTNCKSQVMALACTSSWSAAQNYVQTHTDNIKVQSLMNSIAQLQNTIASLTEQINELEISITLLENYISDNQDLQGILREEIKKLHDTFFKKYSRFIQEGTWQDSNYMDDDKYYLDAIDVAYTSSRPQLQYDINVARLSALEDFSSKTFDVGDICYIQDREFFGYNEDRFTPYKLKIIISEITSYFDSPEKDSIKVQNYKTQFDDLFQRITAATQSLQYAEGGFERAAESIKPDNTLSFNVLQETFDYNENWVLNANNQQVTWDSTGITIIDDKDSALKLRLMAGGLFITNDGGATWKNAVRGDGISTDVLTAGRINTSQIYIYDGTHTLFRWDSSGITAYSDIPSIYYPSGESAPEMSRFIRFDQFGFYGYEGANGTGDFIPLTEDSIWKNSNVKFGFTWKGFFLHGSRSNASLEIADDGVGITFKMKNSSGNNSLEISTENDIILKTGDIKRVQIGRLNSTGTEYGMWVRDKDGNNILNVSSNGVSSISGWTLTSNSFRSTSYTQSGEIIIGLFSAPGFRTTIQGRDTRYYFVAGNNFGIAWDGSIEAQAGHIGGWAINPMRLSGGNVNIGADGNITCTVNGDEMWKLDNDGKGIFNNIEADGGTIAGWTINSNSISSTYTYQEGTETKTKTTSLNAVSSSSDYAIRTDSIYADGGYIGGWGISGNSLSSNGITLNSLTSSIIIGGATFTGAEGGVVISGNAAITGSISANGGAVFLGGEGNTLRLGNTTITEDDLINLKAFMSHQHDYSGWDSVHNTHANLWTGTPVWPHD